MLHGLGVVPFLEALIAFVLLLQGQVGQLLLLLQDFLCLLAFLEHIWGSVLCQRLVIEMDGILVLFFFEIRVASSCISFGNLSVVFLVFSAPFNGLLTKLPVLAIVTLFEVHGCLVGYVSHIGEIQVLGSVIVLQGCVKVLLLIGFIPQLFFFQRLEEVPKKEG